MKRMLRRLRAGCVPACGLAVALSWVPLPCPECHGQEKLKGGRGSDRCKGQVWHWL